MAIAWSSSGSFSNSLPTDDPKIAISRSTTIATIPPGTYGDGARLLLIDAARVGSVVSSFNTYTFTFSGGTATRTVPGGALNTRNDIQVGNAFLEYEAGTAVYQPSGWSFDSGTTISATTIDPTYHDVPQDVGVNNGATITTGSPNVVGVGTHWLTDLAVGQHVWFGSSFANGYNGIILSITDDTHIMLDTNAAPLFSPLPRQVMNVSDTERAVWVAALITYAAGYNPTFPLPPFSRGSWFDVLVAPWAVISATGPFGTITSGAISANTFIGLDPDLTDAYAVVCGVSATGIGLNTPDLVNGDADWSAVQSIGAGDVGVYAAMALWDRTVSGDTTYTWSGFPASGFPSDGGVVMFPANDPSAPPANQLRSGRAYVIA